MIHVYDDFEAVSRAAAVKFVTWAESAIRAGGSFAVALAGGNTPRRLYELLAARPCRELVDWSRVHVFFGDERCVPPDDSRSNYGMAREALLDRVEIPSRHIHPIPTELPPADAAAAYERTLRAALPALGGRFHLALLGLGPDAHTASLLPRTPVLTETERWVAAVEGGRPFVWRITLTTPVLNQSRQVAFLVSGADKAEALAEVRNGPRDTKRLPAQLIQPADGQVVWLVDRPAAERLPAPQPE